MEMKKSLMFLFTMVLLMSSFVVVSAVEGAPEDSLLTSVDGNDSEEGMSFKEIKEKAGMTPDQTFYFLDRAFDSLKSTEKVADERAYELAVLANKSAEGEVDNKTLNKAEQRYERVMEKVQRKSQNREDKSERAANQSTRHLEVLSMVYDKVPEQAKPAIERAMNNSARGRQDSIDSLRKFNESKAEEMQVKTSQRIQNKVSKELRKRIHMKELEQAHIRAMRMNIKCGLYPEKFNTSDLPEELRNRTQESIVTRNELLNMVRDIAIEDVQEIREEIQQGNMTEEQIRQRVEEKVWQRAEFAKDTAESLNENYGRGMGYWKNHYSCPSEGEVPGKGPGKGKQGNDSGDDGIEIEVEIEDGMAEIETEINDTETEFTLNTTSVDEIISEIMNRTGLSEDQVMKYIEFERDRDDTSCETAEDCEGLNHIMVPGEWACVDNECVWETEQPGNDTEEPESNETI